MIDISSEYFILSMGWLGTVLFIVSYLQLNRGKWTVKTKTYHVFNILGSLFLVINTIYDHSYPATTANLFWGLIACYGMWKYRKVEKQV
ncbi:hypothetical protein FNH22_07640 [Fulvivirga sp. M361]|uniref:CBU_0592 family membrane protein n=1 Tax=Fulvivirga sp. M361 TaxID=2594266 RepID=UPI001179A5E8|nr:hypothetical protein [Fulvivirga sp. M361]TRX59917.1 hypothetical protein FNH22_07640 [Fulvivirga sp. M361]